MAIWEMSCQYEGGLLTGLIVLRGCDEIQSYKWCHINTSNIMTIWEGILLWQGRFIRLSYLMRRASTSLSRKRVRPWEGQLLLQVCRHLPQYWGLETDLLGGKKGARGIVSWVCVRICQMVCEWVCCWVFERVCAGCVKRYVKWCVRMIVRECERVCASCEQPSPCDTSPPLPFNNDNSTFLAAITCLQNFTNRRSANKPGPGPYQNCRNCLHQSTRPRRKVSSRLG